MELKLIEEKVRKILVQVKNLEIAPEDLDDDLSDVDSLNLLELIVSLEEEFSIDIEDPDIEFQYTQSVTSLVNLVDKKLKQTIEK